jgi:hypothetical protein
MIRFAALAVVVSLLSAPALALAQCPPDGSPVSTVGAAVTEASRFGTTTVRNASGRIDHRASSASAFSAAGDEWHSLTHLDKMKASEDLITGVPILGPILFIATYPPMIVSDALDVVVSPVMLVKHIFMGVVHGAAGLGQR